jgi:hypothetical protein
MYYDKYCTILNLRLDEKEQNQWNDNFFFSPLCAESKRSFT